MARRKQADFFGEAFLQQGDLLESVNRSGTVALRQQRLQDGPEFSQIGLFDAVPEEYVVNAGWQPRPQPEAESLAPYMAELVCREIARVGKIEAVNLRMGDLDRVDGVDGTSADDAVAAVEKALTVDVLAAGYRWYQHHIVSAGRFADSA